MRYLNRGYQDLQEALDQALCRVFEVTCQSTKETLTRLRLSAKLELVEREAVQVHSYRPLNMGNCDVADNIREWTRHARYIIRIKRLIEKGEWRVLDRVPKEPSSESQPQKAALILDVADYLVTLASYLRDDVLLE